MAWPQATDFIAAIQNPSQSFRDPELLRGQPATDLLLGLPLMYSGNFASVFKVSCPGEQAWAVKCFTRPVTDLQDRYQRISDHLDRQRRKFAVEFVYLPEGIAVKGAWYPVLKMRWVEGFTLNEFLRDHADQPALFAQLTQLWLRLAGELREARMAHGDLQHGNVLLVSGSKSTSLALRLIDYDGLWIPNLAGKPPGEVGHPNYQHPERLASGGYSAEIDRFSHLVIFTALRALALGGKALWDRHDNGENMLFRAADFQKPGKSKLLADLMTPTSDDLRALVGHLVDASQRPLAEVPLLTEMVDGSHIVPLSSEQVDRLQQWLPGTTWPRPVQPVAPFPIALAEPLPAPPMPEATASAPTAILARFMRGSGDVPMGAASASAPLATPKPAPPGSRSPTRSRGGMPPPPPPRWPLPWPELPLWIPRLGLSRHAWLVRYWPVTLGILISMPGLLLLLWLLFSGRILGFQR